MPCVLQLTKILQFSIFLTFKIDNKAAEDHSNALQTLVMQTAKQQMLYDFQQLI